MKLHARHRLIASAVAVIAAVIALGAPPPAVADSSESTNWSGYAVHRAGVRFTRVVGSWIQPQATCTAGVATFSSLWVGIGGYSQASQALEQIGTEADCSSSGRVRSSAWFELVPAASRTIRMLVAPGDRMRAAVSVTGHLVTLGLSDLTTHATFSTKQRASRIDTGSAEWILEAPSLCSGQTCETLPLADFGRAAFSGAAATTSAGTTGTIDDHRWTTTRITLAELGRRFIGGGGPPAATAVQASSLTAGGSAFTVTFHGSSAAVMSGDAVRLSTGRLVHRAPVAPSSR
jgi:hypothetical protein